jgi:hypothetical protein
VGQFDAVAAIPRLRDRQMAASRSDRDRFRRLYIKLTHYRILKVVLRSSVARRHEEL